MYRSVNMNKANDNQEQGSKCPRHDFLSSYFDNELDRTSPEFIHIASCQTCMRKIGVFARIGEIMNRKFSENCPLPEDILEKVRIKISEEKNTEIPVYLIQFMKIAAIFVVIVGVFAFIHGMSGNKSIVPNTVGLKTAPASSAISPAPSAAQNSREIASRKQRPPENGIQYSDMSNVSTGQGIEFRNLPPDDNTAKAEPINIPDYIGHVWTVKNLKDATSEIKDCIAKLGIPSSSISTSKGDDDTLKYSMNLSKKQLAGFVKLFASAGNELLSPTAPQPEQNLFCGNATDPVNYEIKLVPKGK
jgi:hypothetical protein